MLFSVEKIKIPRSAFSCRVNNFLHQNRLKCKARFPMIDTFPHGAPLGGFGAGTLARTVAGNFAVWHLFSGVHIYENIPTCNFAIYQKSNGKTQCFVLNEQGDLPKTWKRYQGSAKYFAQYPFSWYEYKFKPVNVLIEQFTPIIPHNYQETSYPVGCFLVQLENTSNKPAEASVLLSWENLIGWNYYSRDRSNSVTSFRWQKTELSRQNRRREFYEAKGIVFQGESRGGLAGEFCILAEEIEGAKIYFCTSYDSSGDGHEIWDTFSKEGTLHDSVRQEPVFKAGAIAVKVELNPGQVVKIPFVLSWDIPFANQDRTPRYYTRYFDRSGTNAFQLAKEALSQIYRYERKIQEWQEEYAKKLPSALAGLFFNELYYLADGGTLWDADTGLFTFLECYDYYFYETLDVRYYGAFPLAMFWPEIEKAIMRYFIRTVDEEDDTRVNYHTSATSTDGASLAGQKFQQYIQKDYRKRRYALPHDLGSPFENVWHKLNAYTWQNTNRWKDLNSKFVLMIYRAYYYSGKKDREFLAESWPAILKAIKYLETELDSDKDFLPENENFPDQTFDNWLMRGTSAYCGILKLAAMQVAIQLADILEEREVSLQFRKNLKKAKEALDKKLWNGKYYNFDQRSDDIMAAQLMGQWYLDQLHLPAVIEEGKVRSVLETIYLRNFKKFCRGKKGVVNGITLEGKPVDCSQGNDVWVGVNYAYCAHLLLYGYQKEAINILKAIKNQIYTKGMLFRTPESWDAEDAFMASMYMRPGAIWAMAELFQK